MSRFSDTYDGDTLMRADMTTKLSENHLFKSDRASVMESLEMRVPLLDELVLDGILSRPMDHKIVNGRLKAILVALSQKRLPRELWDRPKQEFTVPMARYLSDQWLSAADELLLWGQRNLEIFGYRYLMVLRGRNQVRNSV